jgi:hypothetical protein
MNHSHIYTTKNCTLFMAPDSKILVTSSMASNHKVIGHHLKAIQKTLFRSCTDMWKGVEISQKCSVEFDSSRLQDAFSGILLQKDYNEMKCSIKNSRFFNNQIGLEVGTSAGAKMTFPIINNDFSTDTPNLLAPLQNEIARTGIRLNSVIMASLGFGSNNKFSNSQYGIESYYSTLIIEDGIFFNLKTVPNDNNLTGYGIYSVVGFTGVAYCHFIGGRGGILSQANAELNVSECDFNHFSKYGIEASGFIAGGIEIYHNTFNMDQTGEASAVHYLRPNKMVGIGGTIANNTINVSNTKIEDQVLINVEAAQPCTDLFTISDNTLNNNAPHIQNKSIHGIKVEGYNHVVQSVDGYRILDNHIHYLAPGAVPVQGSFGIAIVFSTGIGNKVSGNDIDSKLVLGLSDNITTPSSIGGPAAKSSWIKCTIHLINSSDWIFCQNRSNHVYRGNHFDGTLGNLEYEENIMGDSYYGMVCQSHALPVTAQDQIQKHNHWPGPYGVNSARSTDTVVGGNISPPFKFKETPTNWPTTATSPTNWFQLPGSQTGINVCPDLKDTVPTGVFPKPQTLSPIDVKIIQGTFVANSAALFWDAKRDLMLRLLVYPELRPNGSLAAQYFQTNQNTEISQFAKAEQLFIEAFLQPNSTQSELNLLFNQQRNLSKQSHVFDSLQILEAVFSPTLFENQRLIDSVLNLVQTSFRNKLDVLKANTQSNLVNVQIAADNLPATEIYKANWRTLLQKAIKKASGQELSQNDFETLRSIANQCLTTGGESVFKASLFLPTQEGLAYLREGFYDEKCASNLQSTDDRKGSAVVLSHEFQIVPNPSSDNFIVYFDELKADLEWNLLDCTGKIWQYGKSDSSVPLSIDAQNIPIGIYFFAVEMSDGTRQVKKVSILR